MAEKKVAKSRFRFTVQRLRGLPVPPKGRQYHYDAQQAGLAVCVTQTGTRTFYLIRKQDGRPERIRLGRFPDVSIVDARAAAAELTGQAARGRDPAAERRARREAPTLQDLFDYWMEHHAKPHKKTWREDQRKFDKHFGTLRTKRLSAVTEAVVQKWHTDLGKRHGPYLANRGRALLSAAWGCAGKLGYSGPNPCAGVPKFRERSRERFLQPGEMRQFFQALRDEEPIWRDFFLLCLFTGARRGNVAAMQWKDVDLEARAWYLPGQQTKNGEPIVVVLSDPAVAVLESRLAQKQSAWVFPCKGRSGEGRIVDPRKAWARVVKRAGIADLRMHDLRRSLGSWQAAAGTSLPIIGKSLGHRDAKATQVYARLQLDPVRQSVEQATAAMVQAGGLQLQLTNAGQDDET